MKSPVRGVTLTDRPVNVGLLAGLVSVRVWVEDEPKLTDPNDLGFGVRVIAATPVPESPTGEPVTGTLALMVTVAFIAPVVLGWNTTLMVQLAPGNRGLVQLPPAAPAGRE